MKPSDKILEIGPGKGHITRELLKLGAEVTAVELDPVLYRALSEKFSDESHLTLVRGNFMDYRLPSRGNYKVFANIPFALTSDIIRKLSTSLNPPRDAWLVVERGAAFRLCSTEAPYYLRSAFTAEICYYISRDEFHPRPRCDAALLHLKRRRT